MDDPASSLLLLFQTTDTGSSVTVTEVLLELLLILVIVGLNAFFVASEFSLVTVRKTRIQKLADEG
ncbi:MAG: CNNM domain-containing protein, partial [Pyrinomonadaceae bacterium]